MTIRKPRSEEILQLRQLWQTVFGDTDAFLDSFFSIAYSPDRCLCAMEGTTLAGMLFWLPCDKYAYIYAVATRPSHRGKGVCRGLMAAAHEAISRQGFEGAILYPQEEGLRSMYRKMGYLAETFLTEQSFTPGNTPVTMEEITCGAYFARRKHFLPEGAVIQDRPFRELMEPVSFYQGNSFLLAAEDRGNTFFGLELLGNPAVAPGILKALGKTGGSFRFPGTGKPFAMFCPLREGVRAPKYFAFPLD